LEAYTRAVERATSELTETHDALLIVGGSGPLVDLANNGRVHELLLGFVRAGKPVAAECYGVSCLAFARQWEDRASILRGKFVTGQDAWSLGIQTLWVDDFDEIPEMMASLED
jgi:putative intracellular protease/amidase